MSAVRLVSYPTRWSLLFIFGFLYGSSGSSGSDFTIQAKEKYSTAMYYQPWYLMFDLSPLWESNFTQVIVKLSSLLWKYSGSTLEVHCRRKVERLLTYTCTCILVYSSCRESSFPILYGFLCLTTSWCRAGQKFNRHWHGLPIPHICDFFTRAKFLESKLYTEKRQFFALNL